jgi:hypothetical protein
VPSAILDAGVKAMNTKQCLLSQNLLFNGVEENWIVKKSTSESTLFWDPSQLWELYSLLLFYLNRLSCFTHTYTQKQINK